MTESRTGRCGVRHGQLRSGQQWPQTNLPAFGGWVCYSVHGRWRIEILSYGTTRTWNYALLE